MVLGGGEEGTPIRLFFCPPIQSSQFFVQIVVIMLFLFYDGNINDMVLYCIVLYCIVLYCSGAV